MEVLIRVAVWLLNAYNVMILVCVVISYLPELQRSKFAEILSRMVDPFLAIFRRFVPSIGGLDVSPLLAMVLLSLAAAGLASW